MGLCKDVMMTLIVIITVGVKLDSVLSILVYLLGKVLWIVLMGLIYCVSMEPVRRIGSLGIITARRILQLKAACRSLVMGMLTVSSIHLPQAAGVA
jgi:hypothetical protein